MPSLQDFTEGVRGRSGNRDRRHDPGLENSQREKRGADVADQRLERLRELRALKICGVDAVMEERRRGENRGDREHRREQGAEKRVEAARR